MNNRFEQWIQLMENSVSDFEKKLAKSEQIEIDINKLDPNNYEESLEKLIAEQRGVEYKELSEQIYNLFEELFKVYVISNAENRIEIEKIFQNKKFIIAFLTNYPAFVSNFIHSPKDTDWLKLGLVAAIIHGGKVDYRDLWISLGVLYTKAKECGIDPVSHFTSVESLNRSNAHSYNSINVDKGVLSDFLKSDYLKSIV